MCTSRLEKKTVLRKSPSMSYCSQFTCFFEKEKNNEKSARIPCLKRIEMRKSKLYFP